MEMKATRGVFLSTIPRNTRVSCHVQLKIKTYGMIPPGLSGSTAVIVGMMLYIVCGHGLEGNINDTYCLDLISRQWEKLDTGEDEQKPSPRDKHTSWHFNNRLYTFGGFGLPINNYLHHQLHEEFVADDSTMNPVRGWNNQLVYLNIADKVWSIPKCSGTVPSPRAAHAATRVDNTVYVFGGRHDRNRLNDLYSLNMDNLQWSCLLPAGEVPQGRSWHTLTAASDSLLFLYGGFSQDDTPLGDIWQYDTRHNLFSQIQNHSIQPRLWHSACCTQNGTVALFGGCSTNILDHLHADHHCDDLLLFRVSPNSLLELTLDFVYERRDLLEPEWDSLPHNLREQLNVRKAEFPEHWGTELPHDRSRGVVCVIA